MQSFGEEDPKRRQRVAGANLIELRLSPADQTVLRWTFDWLEGTMGIASNFGAMIDRVQEGRHFVADVERFFAECCEVEPDAVCALKDLRDVARGWSYENGGAALKLRQLERWMAERGVARIACDIQPRDVRLRARGRVQFQGLRVKPWARATSLPPLSDRIEPETMHVKSIAPSAKAADGMPVEVWGCWANGGRKLVPRTWEAERFAETQPDATRKDAYDYSRLLGSQVHEARAALLAIPVEHAVTLYRMYGQDTAKEFVARYSELGDLVALAEDTDVVAEHAERMTREARHLEDTRHRERDTRESGEELVAVAALGSKLAEMRSRLPERLATEADLDLSDTVEATQRRLDALMARSAKTRRSGWVLSESRVSVTPREALSDLLEPKSGESKEIRDRRKDRASAIVREAGRKLANASKAFRAARTKIDDAEHGGWRAKPGECACGVDGCAGATEE